MEPFLSIIIPVYKIEEKYLRACFDSLLSQTIRDFKIIVIDDGSPDNSGFICDEYAAKDGRFTVIHQVNQGVSVARNCGLDLVDTEWVTFIDPDDWVDENYVSELFELKEKNNADIYLYNYYQEFTSRSKENRLPLQTGKLSEEWIEKIRIAPFNIPKINGKSYEYEYSVLWNKMYRSRMLKNKKLKFVADARKGQDLIFNAEAFQLADTFYYLDKALYHYRYLQKSITNRYNSKIVYYTEVSFKEKERIMYEYSLAQDYWTAYYAHVLTRLYSYFRLYYFNSENKMTKKEITKELNELLLREPYATALTKRDISVLSGMQKIFVFFLKKRMYRVLWLLTNGRQILKHIKGEALQ